MLLAVADLFVCCSSSPPLALACVVDVIWVGGHLLSGVLSPADIQPDWPPSRRLLD